jgi:hypothetical protein
MINPEYAWWHGLYEYKKRLLGFTRKADQPIEHGVAAQAFRSPIELRV